MKLIRKLPLALVLFIIAYAVVAKFFPTVVYLPTNVTTSLLRQFQTSTPSGSVEPKQVAVAFAGTPVDGLKVPAGYAIHTITTRLNRPRVLALTPAGTMLVSEMGAGRISYINSQTGEASSVISGLSSPHGIALYGEKLFVAEEQKLSRYSWDEANKKAVLDRQLFTLPKGGRHFTRSIAFDKEGRMFVSIGSTCDVCTEKHPWLTTIIVSDAEGKTPRVFSSGLRNSVYIASNPQTNQIWGTEMGRDFLGDNLPPDEINVFKDGANYGWPNCYGDRVFDTKGISKDPNICASTEAPAFKIQAHSAPLGLAFDGQGSLFVAYHGSWNRSSPVGYKVVRLKTQNGTAMGEEDFVTGFLINGNITGRPAGLIFDQAGNLYLTDDQAGRIFKVFRR